MPYKKLSEFSCKKNYSKDYPILLIDDNTDFNIVLNKNSWLNNKKLVCKIDNGQKRRGKNGLVILNKEYEEIVTWIHEMKKKGFNKFIIEQFYKIKKELYVCYQSDINGDYLLCYDQGGVDIGNVDEKAIRINVENNFEKKVSKLFKFNVDKEILDLYEMFCNLHCFNLEINPLAIIEQSDINNHTLVLPLDFAVEIDETAIFLLEDKKLKFNEDYLKLTKQELTIKDLDSKTGASLKFNLINPDGEIWTLIAGGGASVVYTDVIINMGLGYKLGNYGEYSGAPSEEFMEIYTTNILQLILASSASKKTIIIGGAIANFTRVDKTFAGIIKAFNKYCNELKTQNISVFVRRGGPYYKKGLEKINDCCLNLGIFCKTYGPEKFITDIVLEAIGENSFEPKSNQIEFAEDEHIELTLNPLNSNKLYFNSDTQIFIWGLHQSLIQRILDFDYTCKKAYPSIKGLIDPTKTSISSMNFFWNNTEILIPVYNNLNFASLNHPNVTTLINLASFRSAAQVTMDALEINNINKILVIAEGIPERWARDIYHKARNLNKLVIGPSSVGLITPEAFRGGNTGGTIENIIASNLITSGQIAILTRSGGLLNEMCNIVSQCEGDIYEALSIGGDRYPGSGFLDHIMRYEKIEKVKMIVILGEVGGIEEILISNAKKSNKIKKPIIAWCLGTSASFFEKGIQFGHAGASATSKYESAIYKNLYMKKAGIIVPKIFEDFPQVLKTQISKNNLSLNKPSTYNIVAKDFEELYKNGQLRKKKTINSSISSDTTHNLKYNNIAIEDVVNTDQGIGHILGLLWFKKQLPINVTKFFDLIITLTADHGPAVSGAHNTIVSARAGKDLVSSLCSGLLTIGPRFGGAIQKAAQDFNKACLIDKFSPHEFVTWKKKNKELIMGIGHKVKTSKNPDKRVEILKDYFLKNFDAHIYLDYALQIEQITLKKKDNLILNVDGCIAACLLDIFDQYFTKSEVEEILNSDILNGLFVLARTIGFIGHYNDQKRLNQGLWRASSDAINFIE
ncbi:ATP citrate lyase citrate-binding [seawater metagenome]|uniref:ATP citrate synthase n=1 Tax=seawater metagenome TaxID=1561972 RepID=A0A5E8CHX6_9ZZZZ